MCNKPLIQSHQIIKNGQLFILNPVFTSKHWCISISITLFFIYKLSNQFQSLFFFFFSFLLMSSEKVEISEDKPYIILQGENRMMTVIQWGDFGRSLESSTFKLLADNFMAREITFKVK